MVRTKRLNVCICIVMLSLAAFSDTETVNGIPWKFTITNGKASVGGGFNLAIPASTSGVIAVPSTLGGHPVASIDAGAFSRCGGITGVTIPDGVTSIGGGCFCDCSNLTQIEVEPNHPTYEKKENMLISKNGELILYIGCYNLTSITLPTSVISLGDSCFENCSNLSNVSLPNTITSLKDYCFYKCTNLSTINIPSSVISLGKGCFGGGCSNLNVEIDSTNPNFFTSNGHTINRKDNNECVKVW